MAITINYYKNGNLAESTSKSVSSIYFLSVDNLISTSKYSGYSFSHATVNVYFSDGT